MAQRQEYCNKDIAINIRAIEKIAPEHEKILNEKPYGSTGISVEEWRMDIKRLQILYLKMMEKEINRLSVMVDKNWIKKTEESTLQSPVPGVVKCLIIKYADSKKII